jgi:hypothetical protein
MQVRVVDSGNQPIIGAVITLGAVGSEAVASTYTDTEGTFQLQTDSTGTYPLTISSPGYQPAKLEKLVITAGVRLSIICTLAQGESTIHESCPPPLIDGRDTSSGIRVTKIQGEIQIHNY